MRSADPFSDLDGHRYMNLTTFRRSGQPVTTPVWFARDGDRVYVMTAPNAGKVKRIRNNRRVQIGPSDVRGRPRGPLINAAARLLPPDQAVVANVRLDRKYGWQKRVFEALETLILRLRRRDAETVFLEIVPGGD
jgi:uncharacterized protein